MRCGFTTIALYFTLLLSFFVSCDNADKVNMPTIEELQSWTCPEYTIDGNSVANELKHCVETWSESMYADKYTNKYYQNNAATLLWIDRMGVRREADTLMSYITKYDDLGLSQQAFALDTLQAMIDSVRNFNCSNHSAAKTLGSIEYLLTRAYMRYACGQRYGFINPRYTFNHLLVDQPANSEKRSTTTYRRIFALDVEEATDSFANVAIKQIHQHRISDFLSSVQPTDTIYRQMRNEYHAAKQSGDTTRLRLASINMERARWRYQRPNTGRYIFVNLAAQQLTAVDTQRDTATTMLVCCGNATHKTPLLHSKISHVELNPYWVIPQTIVSKEIMPSHTGDSAYFARNRYRAINKETKEMVDPASLSAAELRSARYTLRQDKGAGNSLGRVIFRFPNDFSVYLHDTNNHSAFQYANRAISHGCVRVEHPLDLALFFLDNPTPLYVDRIRIAIDRAPLTAEGRRYQAAHPDAKSMPNISYSSPVDIWLDYWTLYPTPDGRMESYPDNYGYDRTIEKKLKSL